MASFRLKSYHSFTSTRANGTQFAGMARSHHVFVLVCRTEFPHLLDFLSINILSVIGFLPLNYNQQNPCINLC